MQFDPLASASAIIVYIDYKSPYAFVAKDPTYALEDQLDIEIDWRPLTLDIPSYLGSAKLDAQGKLVENNRSAQQWSGVRYAYHDARRYARLRGYTLRGTTKIWDSSLAAIGLLWAKQQHRAILRSYSDRVYERFWKRDLDIENPQVIESVLRQAGADVDGFMQFLTGAGKDLHDQMQAMIFDAHIFGVPSYVIAGELFFGREHLPLLRWILTGRRGPPPDISYRHFDADTASR